MGSNISLDQSDTKILEVNTNNNNQINNKLTNSTTRITIFFIFISFF